jgi:hypothetical protein
MTLRLVPAPREEPSLRPGVCIVPGCDRPTVLAHAGVEASGYTPRCDGHSQERDEKLIRRSRPCPCDKTVHEPGGPFCRG